MTNWKALSLALWATTAVTAHAEDMQKVTIGVGTQVLNVTYPWLMMPQAMGYWADEGLEVEVIPVSGSLQAVQMLAAGTIDFAQMGAGTAIQAVSKNGMDLKLVMANSTMDWSIVAETGGPISSAKDLEGKKVGLLSLASSGNALLKSYLIENSVDPDSVSVVATGAGAPALLALQNGSVDALMFWGSMNLSFENMGADLKHLYSESWREMPDFSLVALGSLIEEDPELVEKVVRGAVKGTVFAYASPECTRVVHWESFPDSKPGGAPDEATAALWDDRALAKTLDGIEFIRTTSGGEYWGAVPLSGLDVLQDFLVSTDQIPEKAPVESFVIGDPAFFKTVNDIDMAAIETDAEACAPK